MSIFRSFLTGRNFDTRSCIILFQQSPSSGKYVLSVQEMILHKPFPHLPTSIFPSMITNLNSAASSMQSYLQRLLRCGARHDDHNNVHQRGGCHPLPRIHTGDRDGDGDDDDMKYLNMNSQQNCDLADVHGLS